MELVDRKDIKRYRLFTLRSALQLEIKGLRKKGRSAYSIVKEEFNLKGSKQKVLTQLNNIIADPDGHHSSDKNTNGLISNKPSY